MLIFNIIAPQAKEEEEKEKTPAHRAERQTKHTGKRQRRMVPG
jgi:hypothetical protein